MLLRSRSGLMRYCPTFKAYTSEERCHREMRVKMITLIFKSWIVKGGNLNGLTSSPTRGQCRFQNQIAIATSSDGLRSSGVPWSTSNLKRTCNVSRLLIQVLVLLWHLMPYCEVKCLSTKGQMMKLLADVTQRLRSVYCCQDLLSLTWWEIRLHLWLIRDPATQLPFRISRAYQINS